jgi:hypothetical protein
MTAMQMSTGLRFIHAIEMAGKIHDGVRFQRMLMRRTTSLLLAQVGKERPTAVDCNAEIAIAALFPLQVLQFRFTIDDWSMVTVVEMTAKRQVLRIEPSTLRESDGPETYGLIGWVEGNPVIAVTAAPNIETVFVRIGGFDRSIVLHDGVLNGTRGNQ